MEVDERGIRRHVNGLDALQAPDLFLFPSDELRDSLGVGRALHDNRPVSLSCNMHTVTECAVVLAREEVLEVLDDLIGTPSAHLKRHGAPRVESTRQRGDHKIRWVAPQDRPRHRLADDWDRRHERFRVRVLRVSQHLTFVTPLHDLAGVHDVHVFSEVRDHGDVVCNQEHADSVLLLKPPEQVQNLRLDGHVQGGRRFVKDQQLRVR